jgi:hypothetical protein
MKRLLKLDLIAFKIQLATSPFYRNINQPGFQKAR